MINKTRTRAKPKFENIIQITMYRKIWKDHVGGMSEDRGPRWYGIVNLWGDG
jgi:hypothetical protein